MTASVYNLHVDLAHLKRNVKKKTQEQVQSSGKVGIKEVLLILL